MATIGNVVEQLTSKKLVSFGSGVSGVVAIAGMMAAGSLGLWPGMILATFVASLSGLHIWRQSAVDIAKVKAGIPPAEVSPSRPSSSGTSSSPDEE